MAAEIQLGGGSRHLTPRSVVPLRRTSWSLNVLYYSKFNLLNNEV